MASAYAEAVLAAFDSSAEIRWEARGTAEAIARFTIAPVAVTVVFQSVMPSEWRVSFDTAPKDAPVASSIKIFSGVFQAVREFLEIRQPERLVFATKHESLSSLYAAYLERQDTTLRQMGYIAEPTFQASPLAEYSLRKLTPSEWNEQ